MMTEESTMMPKSTAPIDSRLADLCRRNSTAKANSSASGILIATIRAARTLLRNISKITATRSMPTNRFSRTVSVGHVDQPRTIVEGLDLHARQQVARLVQLVDLGFDVDQRGNRLFPLAQQNDGLHLVVEVNHFAIAGQFFDFLLVDLGTRHGQQPLARLRADHYAALAECPRPT